MQHWNVAAPNKLKRMCRAESGSHSGGRRDSRAAWAQLNCVCVRNNEKHWTFAYPLAGVQFVAGGGERKSARETVCSGGGVAITA
jgi:hypothetical protein